MGPERRGRKIWAHAGPSLGDDVSFVFGVSRAVLEGCLTPWCPEGSQRRLADCHVPVPTDGGFVGSGMADDDVNQGSE